MHAATRPPLADARAPRGLSSTAAPLASAGAATITLQQLQPSDLQWLPALTHLLIDNVHQGACLGFVAPMSRYAAMDYWQGVFARLGPQQRLWIACDAEGPGRLLGAVQLAFNTQPAAHHRGEVQRLMVHSQERGRGIAGRLLARAESVAATQGRHLLELQAPAQTQAEAVFAHLGWQRAGEIPEHSRCGDGRLLPTALYYKRLPHRV
ncbi:GNAT family N-acetyltransferase [Pelomonas sp. CA6]|mgnify:CR=1 FL=1|uniref:GNAT family N-acetyltransferase n=1 Tax=Pelomonas sp. CA6 TaxID=2907999 RepID=UPI001F4C342D|nr:GNAT family N-acetyltransferase [Pelomonas sp. CA6]MCH7344713.1 GNAT family N-acetyltransferase [Pelomonas sp. CA6]